MKATNRVKIALVTGARRTGSTLLGSILACIPGVFNVGELRLIWHWGLVRNYRCGCGKRFLECPFWTTALPRAFGARWKDLGPGMLALRSEVDRMRHAPQLLAPRYQRQAFRAATVEYRAHLATLYRAVAEVSGSAVIADVSKSPSHGLLLKGLAEFDLDILHLVRDSRAVVCSWQREKRVDPEAGVQLRRQRAARVSAGWVASNLLAEALGHVAGSYRRLTYEELALRPSLTMDGIAAFLGLGEGAKMRDDASFEMPIVHSVGGNAVQYERGQISVRLDDRWRRDLSFFRQSMVTMSTLPLLARYGYLTDKTAGTQHAPFSLPEPTERVPPIPLI